MWTILLKQTKANIEKAKALHNITKEFNITGLSLEDTAKLQSDIQSLINHLKNVKIWLGPFENKIIKESEYLWSKIKLMENWLKIYRVLKIF